MTGARQIIALTLANVRSIPQRLGASLVIVIGIAGVVAVTISVLSMAVGLRQTMANGGNADRAIVLSRGAESELASTLSRSNVLNLIDAPGIRRTRDGDAIASADLLIQARVVRRSDGANSFVTLRGVSPNVFALRPESRLVAGRMFHPGVRELLVGKAAQAQFTGLDLGSRVRLREGEWTVVGTFSSNQSSRESELLADAETVMSAYRITTFQSVTALISPATGYDAFKKAIASDPTLMVDVTPEPEYLLRVSQPLNRMLSFVAYLIGGIMAIGALAGALNTMYSAVGARRREIATLRAIGFSGRVVTTSILVEALLLAGLGAGIGVSLAYLLFNGHAISTLSGGGDDSQLVFSLTVTPGLVGAGVAIGCLIGFLGGLFPAIQVARQPVVAALRAS